MYKVVLWSSKERKWSRVGRLNFEIFAEKLNPRFLFNFSYDNIYTSFFNEILIIAQQRSGRARRLLISIASLSSSLTKAVKPCVVKDAYEGKRREKEGREDGVRAERRQRGRMECLLLGEHFIFQMAPLSLFPGQKRLWLKRESQPGAIVAHGSSIFHPHLALLDSGRTRDWIFNPIPDFVLRIYAHSTIWSWIIKRNSRKQLENLRRDDSVKTSFATK